MRYEYDICMCHSQEIIERHTTKHSQVCTNNVFVAIHLTTTCNKLNMTVEESEDVVFQDYVDESQLEHVTRLVERDLSEPYSSRLQL